MLTPPRRISLPTTSFFGTTAQGIHCRLVALRRTKDSSKGRSCSLYKLATISGNIPPYAATTSTHILFLYNRSFTYTYRSHFGYILKSNSRSCREAVYIYICMYRLRYTSLLTGVHTENFVFKIILWTRAESNRLPLHCK